MKRLACFALVFCAFAACNSPKERAAATTPAPAPTPAPVPPPPPPPPPAAEEKKEEPPPAPANPALDPAKLTATAPATYKAKFETSKGDFIIEVQRAWAPKGADRFFNLVKSGFYDDTRFFRVVDGFMVQWGIHGDPGTARAWRDARIDDDPVTQSNKRGFVSFATAGPNTRTTQVFINFVDRNEFLDRMGFAPFGKVTKGMEVVDKLYKLYGEGQPSGRGPFQPRLQSEGNKYLKAEFPELDYVKKASIVK